LRSSRLGTDAIRLITAVSDPGEVAGLPHEPTKTRSPCQDDMLPSRAAWHWLSTILALRRPCFFRGPQLPFLARRLAKPGHKRSQVEGPRFASATPSRLRRGSSGAATVLHACAHQRRAALVGSVYTGPARAHSELVKQARYREPDPGVKRGKAGEQ